MPDPTAARIPPELRERYRLVRTLGRGGMGVVLEVEDRSLGRHVALKLSHMTAAGEQQARFLREAKVAARIRHPHVIEVYDGGVAGGSPYLTMELIEGRPLSDVPRPADPGRIFQAIAEALEAIHAAGVVHRDVKPSNILLAGDRVLLTDFGLVHDPDVTKLTRTGTLAGTLAYMAPEVLQGQPISPAADWWALGVSLFQVLEGRLPYQPHEVMQFPSRLVPPCPRLHSVPEDSPLARMTRAWMSREPAERPTSVAAMRRLLGESEVELPAPVPRRVPPALLVAGGLGAVFAAVALFYPGAPSPAPPPSAPVPTPAQAVAYPAISAALAALDSPDGQDQLLDLDPWAWGEALGSQPALRELLPLIATPEARGLLAPVDARLEAMDLPPLLAPHRNHRPATAPCAADDLPGWERLAPLRARWPPRVGGHLSRAVAEVVRMDELFTRIEEDIKALEVGDPTSEAFPFKGLPSPVIAVSGWDLVQGSLETSVDVRLQAHRWWSPTLEAYRASMAAVGASLRKEPETRAAAAVLGSLATERIQHIYGSWLMVLHSDWLLGHEPRTPEAWALCATIRSRQVRSAMLGKRKPPEQVRDAQVAARRGLSRSGQGPLAGWVRAMALYAMNQVARSLDESPELRAAVAGHLPWILEQAPPPVARRLVRSLVSAAREHPHLGPLDPATARRALAYLEATPGTRGDLPGHRQEQILGQLRRLGEDPSAPGPVPR